MFRLESVPLYCLRLFLIFSCFAAAKAQQTNNSSTVTNNAAPAASSTTTGGTNINYQTNNAYNNENGFGAGIFCRTPTLQLGGNWGRAFLDAYDPVQTSGNANINYTVSTGLIIPFGSSVLDDCKRMVAAIARDREISSQLSMLRTCAQLKKEGLVVDPIKYPMLAPCAESTISQVLSIQNEVRASQQHLTNTGGQDPKDSVPSINLTPRTNRLL